MLFRSIKRFYKQQPPLTVEEISTNYQIPSKLTAQVLGKLSDIGIICEVMNENEKDHSWQPAMDIHQISVGLVLNRLDEAGSEDFKIDRDYLFSKEWQLLVQMREEQMQKANSILLLDLQS